MPGDFRPPGDRKTDHLRLAAGARVSHAGLADLESVRLRARDLPQRNLEGASPTGATPAQKLPPEHLR